MEINHWVTAVLAFLALVLSAFNLSEVGLGRIRGALPHVTKMLRYSLTLVGFCSAVFLIVNFFIQDTPPTRGDIGGLVMGLVSLMMYIVTSLISLAVKAMRPIAEATLKLSAAETANSGGVSGESPPNSST